MMTTEARLVLRAQQGDRAAFGELARTIQPRLQAVLRRVLGDDEAARDTCQETLLRAWLNIGRLRDPERLMPWVQRIALNASRDHGRREGPRSKREVAVEAGHLVAFRDPTEDPADAAVRSDEGSRLAAALHTLPTAQRTAILMAELGGYSSREIAEITGVPAATVRTRIYYGLRALRDALTEPTSSKGDDHV